MGTVLIADDELHITYVLALNLRDRGLDVLTANDGQVAFDIALEEKPDLLVTDLQMPSLNGYELALKLQEHPDLSNIPILMLTARGHLLNEGERAKAGISCLMEKPFSPKEFMAKVEELMQLPPDPSLADLGDPDDQQAA